MLIREVLESEREDYNRVVNHPLQSWEWGEFRQKTWLKALRLGGFDGKKLVCGFQLTVHPIPKTSYTVGFLPRGPLPDKPMLDSLKKIGKSENCLFIKLEP
ncbi:MAG: femAB, partial [Microgenomates group bacterium LiPW_16]